MPRYTQDETDRDPNEIIRRRVTEQLDAQQPEPAPTATPPEPAPFETQPVAAPQGPRAGGDPLEDPNNPPPYIPPPTPTPAPAPPTTMRQPNDIQGGTVYPDRATAPAAAQTPSPTAGYLKSLIDAGMDPQQAVALFNQQTGRTHGNEAVFYGADVHGVPTIGLPEAYLAFGPNGWWIQQRAPEQRSAVPPMPTAPRTTAAQPSTSASTSSAQGLPTTAQMTAAGLEVPPGLWSPDFIAQLRQMILQRLNAAGAPVNENDPQINAPLTAARDETTRHTEKERAQLAERLYARGDLNTDALTQGIQQSSERNAQALSGLRATLISRELQSRRDDLRDALDLAIRAGDAETARQVQLQLAALDALLRREGYGVTLATYGQNQNALANQSVL